MGFKDKMTKYYSDAYMEKYGDRMTSVAGTILSVKTEVKSILGIFNKLHVFLVVKPEVGKQVVKCEYKKNRWFKKPQFIDVNQGHKVIIMGLKVICKNIDAIFIIPVCFVITLLSMMLIIPVIKRYFSFVFR